MIRIGNLSELFTTCLTARGKLGLEAGEQCLLTLTIKQGERKHSQVFANATASEMAVDIQHYMDGQGLDGSTLDWLVSAVASGNNNRLQLA